MIFLVILYIAASKATSTESFIYHLAPVLVEKWYGSYLPQIRDSHAIMVTREKCTTTVL